MKNNNMNVFLTIALMMIALITGNGYGAHFTHSEAGDNNLPIILPAGLSPTIDGVELEDNDEVGLFTSSGICAGSLVWEVSGDAHAVVAWSDNSVDSLAVDGFLENDTIFYRIWDNSENRELSAEVTYSAGGPLFKAVSTYYMLSALTAITPVAITSSLSDTSIYVGDDLTLSVVATGGAPVAYQWQKDGVDISGANSSSYVINQAALSDSGNYWCVAVNGGGVDTSDSAIVSVVNRAPLYTSANSQKMKEDGALAIIPAMTDATDPEGDSLFVILEDGANYSISGNMVNPDENFYGELSVPVKISDSYNTTSSINMTITVDPVNDLPVLLFSLNDTVVTVGNPITYIIPDDLFEDVDDDSLVISVSGLPAGITFSEGSISGSSDVINDYNVVVTATDDSSATVSDTFVLSIQPEMGIVEEVEEVASAEYGFTAAPNIVRQDDGAVHFVISKEISGKGSIVIFDALGDVIDEQEVTINSGRHYRWDLTNKYGVTVANGTYVAVLKLLDFAGNYKMFKTKVGVFSE